MEGVARDVVARKERENLNRDTEILDFAKRLAGDNADETVLEAMCAAAADEMEARLKEGISASELGKKFITASGVLALSMYCALGNSGGLKSFKAGNLAVEYGDGDMNAEKLRAIAEKMLSEALADRGFAFLGVAG